MGTQTNPDLEARIQANPKDRDAYAVYGDWLSERNDPRGELIAVQMKLEQQPDDKLRAREKALLDANREAWLGELAKLDPKQDLMIGWRWGFINSIQIGPDTDDYETSEADFPDVIAKLAKIPYYDLIRDYTIGAFNYDDYPTSWGSCIEALVEARVPANLRSLAFDRGGYWDISSTELGNLPPLYPQLQQLQKLYIEMGSIGLGKIDLPALERLEIVTGGLGSDDVKSITSAQWPNLHSLLLNIGETGNDYGCTVQFDDLVPIFAAENLPKVKHLALANSSLADQIAAALIESRIIMNLETLDLSNGMMTDEGARAILDKWVRFQHLEKIDLSHGYFSEDVIAEFKAKQGPEVILDDMQSPDEDYRYCRISE